MPQVRPALRITDQSDLPVADTPDPEAIHRWNARCAFNRWQIRTAKPRARLTPTKRALLIQRSREYDGDIDPILYAIDALTKPNGFHANGDFTELHRAVADLEAVEHWANRHPQYQSGQPHAFAALYAEHDRRPG